MKTFATGYRPASLALLMAVLLTGAFWTTPALGGNREMVEERTEELEEINRQAVGQIPEGLPQEGLIELEAEIVGKGAETNVEIRDYSIRRGQIPRKNQTRIGNEAVKAKGSIPRHDPAKQ